MLKRGISQVMEGLEKGMKSHARSKSEAVAQGVTCPRCGGCLVIEDFVDLGGSWRAPVTASWRCMNCGNRVDELILQHQHIPLQRPIRGGSRSRAH